MSEIKVMFDPNTGDAIIDAHDSTGGHIAGSEEFTEKLAVALGKIDERHKGGHHRTTIKDVTQAKA